MLTVHRDLKPQNILLKLTPSNEVIPLISDFGLCHELAPNRTHMTTKYGMAGTLGWIAPEMSEDKSKVVSVFLHEITNFNKENWQTSSNSILLVIMTFMLRNMSTIIVGI